MLRGFLALLVIVQCALPQGARYLLKASSRGSTVENTRAYRESHELSILKEFEELLSIPNVASDAANIRLNANKLVEMMHRRGIAARLFEGSGSPAVFGELRAPGARTTIGLYAHYDGQPVERSKWATDPFKPVLRTGILEAGASIAEPPAPGSRINPEWRIYARSASDDKAAIVAILTALDAVRAAGKSPSVNLKFLFDGEEEAGSSGLPEIARAHSAELAADVWLCADGPVHQSRRQQLYFGCRG